MVTSLNNVGITQQYGTLKSNNNLYQVNFRADENDRYMPSQPRPQQPVRQPQPVPQRPRTAPPANSQQAMLMRKLQEAEEAQKKEKRKSNIAWAVSVAAGLAIVASLFFKGGKGNEVGEFKMSNLEFKNFKDNKKIFDLKTTKSLHPDVKKFFADMAEMEAIPEEILKHAGIFESGGSKAVILFGNSGVGKSELVKAYAKHVDADYVAISLADFANSFQNGTAINIKEMFNALIARANANPKKQIVVSLDEIDAIIQRATGHSSDELSKNRQSLIMCLDRVLECKNVKLFASSNADILSLDAASVRRFGYNFTVPMPDKGQIKEALKFQLRNCKDSKVADGKFFENNKELDKFIDTLIDRKGAFGDVKNIVEKAGASYALDMHRAGDKITPFKVEYLIDALNNIENTAGEMAAAVGAAK